MTLGDRIAEIAAVELAAFEMTDDQLDRIWDEVLNEIPDTDWS
jgi:hypothetical protein